MGWNGFTTAKLAPCRVMANLVALVYNWWHLYARLYDGAHHREAISCRPALLGGCRAAHAPRRPAHRESQLAARKQCPAYPSYRHVSNTLRRFYIIAERWPPKQRWALLLTHIFRHWLGGKWLGTLPTEANLLLSG